MAHNEEAIQNLVYSAKEGETESVGQLYEHFSQRIYRFIAYRVTTREEAEDLTQEVFLEMIRSLPRYREQKGAKFSTWLFQIARFTLIDHYRTKRRTVPIETVADEGNVLLRTDPAEVNLDVRAETVRQKMRELPEKYQTVLHLSFVEEMNSREIAKAMSVSVISVRVWKHRALKKLSSMISQP